MTDVLQSVPLAQNPTPEDNVQCALQQAATTLAVSMLLHACLTS